MVNAEEDQLNPQFLMIALASATASFLVSLMWSNFVTSSVDEVQKLTKHRIPAPVANLMSAIIVTLVVVLLMCILFRWEHKVGEKFAKRA